MYARGVKTGVLQFFSWPGRRVDLPTVFARACERIEIMDRTGYDAVWLTEHHFTDYSVCPSALTMAAHVAGRTRRLRIGTGVSLAALYHPLRLAEEAALVDVLSEGRLDFGVGRGFDPREFAAYGIDPDESRARYREALDLVLAAWRSPRVDFDGVFHQCHGVEVLPRPVQQPHPPVWAAASSPEAIVWSARQGHSILMDPHARHTDIASKRKLYFDELERAGHETEGREIPIARLLAVAPDEARAREVAERGAGWMLASYVPGQMVGGADPRQTYVDEVVIRGSPSRVRDEIARLREEIGLDYLLCAPLSHESFTLFSDEVLPHLPA